MATIFEEPCDGTNGANATTSNTEFTGFNPNGTLPQFSTAQKFTGTASINCSASGTYRYCIYTSGAPQSIQGRRFYFRMGGAPSATAVLCSAEASATIRAQMQVLTDGRLRIRNGTTAVGSQSNILSFDTWYRAEWWLNNTTSQQRCAIYVGDSGTAFYDSGNQTYNQGTFNDFKVGCITNTSWSNLYIDQVIAVDTATFPGPSATPIGITTPADFSMLLGDSQPIAMTKTNGSGTPTYLWTVQSGPDLSNSQFANRNAQSTSFTPTLAGSYVLLGEGADDTGSDSDTTGATVSSPDRMRFSRAVVIQG